jgi:hypothetical protein
MGWTVEVRFPAEVRFFSSSQRPDRLAHPALYNVNKNIKQKGAQEGTLWYTRKKRKRGRKRP